MIPQKLNEALQLHRSGRLKEAEKLYTDILSQDPRQVDCLHQLGLLAYQSGDYRGAVRLIGKAIDLRGDIPFFHYNIAGAHIALGALREAQRHYEQAVALKPDYAEAHNNLGFILLQQKKPEQAVRSFQKALAINVNYADARNNLGLALRDLGRLDEARACFEKALTLKPDYVAAMNNLGLLLRAQGKPDEAIIHYEQALRLQPNYVEAINNFGNALRDIGRLEEAQAQFGRALALKPEFAEAHGNLGNVCKDKGQMEEALKHYERAMTLKPDFAPAYYNTGALHQEAGRHKEAAAFYAKTLEIDPQYPDALWNQSLLLLLYGEYERGWKQYERRWLKKGLVLRSCSKPLWDGRAFEGQTVLLHCEQGLGDSLQFVRYAPMVKARGGRVALVCPPTLASIFESVKGVDQIIPEGKDIPDHDWQAPLMSLPMIFGTTVDTIPADIPYLTAPPDRVAAWAERLKEYGNLKVGLVWAGNPRKHDAEAHAIDRRRSMTLERLAPLGNVSNVTFFSLQKGEPAAQTKQPPFPIVDWMDEVKDFADTAALIDNLDLIIGVDTSVIHMAGVLGKPTWVLSRFDGCWRWLLDREDSPWYPTMRLFRQTQAGDWETVVERVVLVLVEKAGG